MCLSKTKKGCTTFDYDSREEIRGRVKHDAKAWGVNHSDPVIERESNVERTSLAHTTEVILKTSIILYKTLVSVFVLGHPSGDISSESEVMCFGSI